MYNQDTRLDGIGLYLANIPLVIEIQHLKGGGWLLFPPQKVGKHVKDQLVMEIFPANPSNLVLFLRMQ